jgi:molybdate transport system substrate-binding protein
MIRLLISLYCYWFMHGAMAATATIATASNFKETMNELITQFEQSQPHQLRQVNAASGILFNQIRHGAPFDALLAADSRYPLALEQQGLGVSGSRFTYAIGALVLVSTSPLPNMTEPTAEAFRSVLAGTLASGGKIAMAHPNTAPYGRAAQQVLHYLQIAPDHQMQLVRAHNINQSFQFVATGNAALGFAARSQLAASASQLSATNSTALYYWPVPTSWHQPIRQQAILLQSAQHNLAAVSFLHFLTTEEAQIIIRRHGYNTP